MRLKYLTIFLAVLAAASLPRTAHAQDFAYDSYGVYDPNSNEISGYSITVDYMGYGVPLEADSDLLDPDEETVDSSSYDDVGEAEADVYCVPDESGNYEIEGSHWYEWNGWNWLGESYYDVGVTPAGTISYFTEGTQPPWYSGDSYSIDIYGSGFTVSPWLEGCIGNDQGSWYVTDTQISGVIQVPPINGPCTLTIMLGPIVVTTATLITGWPACDIPYNLVQPSQGQDVLDGRLLMTYSYQAVSNFPLNLWATGCEMREAVQFPVPLGDYWDQPAPFPQIAVWLNPYYASIPIIATGYFWDTQSPAGTDVTDPQFRPPYFETSFEDTQVYQFHCPCYNYNLWTDLSPQMTISNGIYPGLSPYFSFTVFKTNISPLWGYSAATLYPISPEQ